jgi:3-hydroxy-9,10-secoandrosta-1,3,5(10)-triene-9,17-dione monooxygenase reductase component
VSLCQMSASCANHCVGAHLGCGRSPCQDNRQIMSDSDLQSCLAPVLGRVPSGVFILVAGDGNGRRTGLLTSWVQQASFEPPQVTIAVPKGDNLLFRHFSKGFDPNADAFVGIDVVPANNGLVALSSALATMEGSVCGQMDAGDHRILLVTITNAVVHKDLTQSEPFVHVRKNGFSY